MEPITPQTSEFTRLALDARDITETHTPTGRRLDATIQLRPVLNLTTLGAPREMTLTITEEDQLCNITVTYCHGSSTLVHERFHGVHPADVDGCLHTLSHASSTL